MAASVGGNAFALSNTLGWLPARCSASQTDTECQLRPSADGCGRFVHSDVSSQGVVFRVSAAFVLAGAVGVTRRPQKKTGRFAAAAAPDAESAAPNTTDDAESSALAAQAAGAAGVAATEPQTEKVIPPPFPPPTAASQQPPFDPTKEVGVTEPLGFFDPLGFSTGKDRKNFRKLRTAEMKHGRVAMLASVGLVAQHYIRFPGGIFDDVPNGITAPVNPTGGFGTQILVFVCLVVEFVVWPEDPNREIGDQGDPFGVGMYDTEMRNRELNNGRAAMFATMGILIAEFASGKDAMEQLDLP